MLSHVLLFATTWTVVHLDSLSSTISQSLKSIESVTLSNHLILCRPLLLLISVFPASESFPVSGLFALGGQIIGASKYAPLKKICIDCLLLFIYPKHSLTFWIEFLPWILTCICNCKIFFECKLDSESNLSFRALSSMLHSNGWISV